MSATKKRRRRDCDFDRLPPRSSLPAAASIDPLVHHGMVTEMLHCHNCKHSFSARVDYRLDGNHVIVCPFCGHQHCRVIHNGRVTGDRWETREETIEVMGCRWTANSHPMETSSVFEHVRNAWLERLR